MAAIYYQTPYRQGEVDLSTSIADVVAGGAHSSDVIRLSLVNTGSTDRIVTFYDENNKYIDSVLVPANAGLPGSLGTTVPAVDAINGGLWISGTRLDAYQNRTYGLAGTANKIRAKQDTGTDIQVQYLVADYAS